jgi:hypothetical protein
MITKIFNFFFIIVFSTDYTVETTPNKSVFTMSSTNVVADNVVTHDVVTELAEQRRIAYVAYWSAVHTATNEERRALARQVHDADFKWRSAVHELTMGVPPVKSVDLIWD